MRSANGGRVFAMHGVLPAIDRACLAHRNFVSADRFIDHLRHRESLYVDLDSALAGAGDALTIDDATVAAYDAALAARRHGHAVTLFVNPYNVVTQRPYSFAQLRVVIDRTQLASVSYAGRQFDLTTPKNRVALRQQVKSDLLKLPDEPAACAAIDCLADALEVRDRSIPRFLQPLTKQTLRELHDLGVRIGNHGWTHASVDGMSLPAVRDAIVQAKRWIEDSFRQTTDSYAVPFGKSKPPFVSEPSVYRDWLLNNSSLPAGYLASGLFNRETLRLPN